MHRDFIPNIQLNYFILRYCDSNWHIVEREIEFHNLMFVLSGSFSIYHEGKEMVITRNQAVYSPKGTIRKADKPSPDTVIAAFDFFTENGNLPVDTVTALPYLADLESTFLSLNDAWISELPGNSLKCHGLFYIILHHLLYHSYIKPVNSHIQAIKRFINSHYTQPLSMQPIAETVGLNPVYCGALFKKEENLTISEYINRIRIHAACAYLMDSTLSVSEIAYLVGFQDIYYFSRTFKKIKGVSPAHYRKQ